MINADRADLKTAAVYKIVWLKDKLNRVYIGQTKNLHRRMADYKTACKSLKKMKSAHAPWLLHICKTENVGSLDFDKDFEVTVLEFVDGLEGAELKGTLNQLEIKYISEYHSYDPTFKHGFNFTRGGAGDYWSRKGKRNVYLRTANNRAIVRNTLIVFDIETCSYRQFLSFTAAEAALGIPAESLKHSYYEPVLCGKKYIVLSADPEKRRRHYDRCLCKRFELYYKYPESDHSTRALVLKESMKITSRFAMAEDAICNNNDVNIACLYETVHMLY